MPVRLYAANILTTASIEAASGNLKGLNFTDQLEDENLGIGNDTWIAVATMEEEHDTKPFFVAVRKFYEKSIKKMILKFPFGDSLMCELEILLPGKLKAETALALAKRFPQLHISDSASLDNLREECMDYILSPADLPKPVEYTAADVVDIGGKLEKWSS